MDRFVTIWIFARIRPGQLVVTKVVSFVTIWIFARIRHEDAGSPLQISFVTIWIFARIRQGSRKVDSFNCFVTI